MESNTQHTLKTSREYRFHEIEVKINIAIFYLLYFVHHIKSPEMFGVAHPDQILTYLRAGGGQFAAVGVHYGN